MAGHGLGARSSATTLVSDGPLGNFRASGPLTQHNAQSRHAPHFSLCCSSAPGLKHPASAMLKARSLKRQRSEREKDSGGFRDNRPKKTFQKQCADWAVWFSHAFASSPTAHCPGADLRPFVWESSSGSATTDWTPVLQRGNTSTVRSWTYFASTVAREPWPRQQHCESVFNR